VKNVTTPKYSPLPKSFYEVSPVQLARKLIGTMLVRSIGRRVLAARIVEAEAYGGSDDPASHAYRGMTERNRVMFDGGGFSYVYFTYGMHFCFNVVAGKGKKAGAALIRAAEPVEGIDIMKQNRGKENLRDLLSGPAKLCQAFAIDRSLNGIALDKPLLFISRGIQTSSPKILTTTRIGIQTGTDKKWRFVDAESEYLSVKVR
jgi:DNA-3-methyladenine glycosylase